MHIQIKSYKAVIFDLDGTLLNTIEDIADACNSALEKMGFPAHPVSAYRDFVGQGMRHLVKRALPGDVVTSELIDNVQKHLTSEYSKHMTRKTKPYPGIMNILRSLCEKGIKVAILSNKPQEMVEKIVGILLPGFHFQVVMGTNERFPRKPDPRSTRYILEEMEESPGTTLFIGDSEIDIYTARNAGMDSISVGWGFRDISLLQGEGADMIIQNPGDLLRFFSLEK